MVSTCVVTATTLGDQERFAFAAEADRTFFQKFSHTLVGV